jgi:hypothetical protein
MTTPLDMKGFAFNVGCKVARAVMSGQSPRLDICEVTRIKDGKIYLNNSRQAITFPDRLLIIEQDPLYRMVKKYDQEK